MNDRICPTFAFIINAAVMSPRSLLDFKVEQKRTQRFTVRVESE
jgi:hypothetical protein